MSGKLEKPVQSEEEIKPTHDTVEPDSGSHVPKPMSEDPGAPAPDLPPPGH